MARLTNAELLQRIAALEEENASLRLQTGHQPRPAAHRRRGVRTLFATVLIVLGGLLAPSAVVASWAKAQLTDTDAFVATYAPLADDPGVRSFITDQAVKAAQDELHVSELTAQVIDGITNLGTGPVATRALDALKGPLADGILSLVRSTVQRFVSSSAFAAVWEQALRTSHEQLIATMQGDPEAIVAVGSDGSVGIQLGPIVDRVKRVLIDQGIGLAARIPSVDRTVTVAQDSSIPALQLVYGVAVAAGAWLPWAVLALLALGVVVARRRLIALVSAATALGLAMAATLAAIGVGGVAFVGSVAPSLLPAGVARTLFTAVTAQMAATALAVLVLAAAVAAVGWAAGPSTVAARLRGLFTAGAAAARSAADRHGVTTGRAGEWMHAQRVLLRSVVAAAAASVVLFVRPLTPPLIVWTLLSALLAVVVLELLQRPPVPPRPAAEGTSSVTVS